MRRPGFSWRLGVGLALAVFGALALLTLLGRSAEQGTPHPRDARGLGTSGSRSPRTLAAPPARSWPRALAPPATRLAYATGEGLYLRSIPGTTVRRLVDNIDVKRGLIRYIPGLGWSPDGRFLAWTDYWLDPQTTDAVGDGDTLTLLDTESGRRISWQVRNRLRPVAYVISRSNVILLSENALHFFAVGASSPHRVALERSLPAQSIGWATRGGVMLYSIEPAGQGLSRVRAWMVSYHGAIRELQSSWLNGEFDSSAEMPAAKALLFVVSRQITSCRYSDSLKLVTLPRARVEDIRLPPSPANRTWAISMPEVGDDGEVHVGLTAEPNDCSGGVSDTHFYRLADGHLRPQRLVRRGRNVTLSSGPRGELSLGKIGRIATDPAGRQVVGNVEVLVSRSGRRLGTIRDVRRTIRWSPGPPLHDEFALAMDSQ